MTNYEHLQLQRAKIERLFNCFTCRIKSFTSNELICTASLKPFDSTDTYEVEIRQKPKKKPVVKIKSPHIEPNPKIHTYSDGSLCLYYPLDMAWKPTMLIAEYTIPWILEWIIYYEIYKITGSWEGKEAPHSSF